MAVSVRPPIEAYTPNLQPYPTEKTRHTQRIRRFFGKHLGIYGTPNFAILAGDAGMHLAKQVADVFGKEVPENLPPFANHELRVAVPAIVETKDVYVIQTVDQHPNRSLRHMKLLGIGAKGRNANRLYYMYTGIPYTRQDRIDQPGAPRAAQNVDLELYYSGSHNPHKLFRHESKLTAPASLLVVDVHSEKPLETITKDSRGIFQYRRGRYQWANLDSAYVLEPKVRELIAREGLNVAVAFPDKGAAKRYNNYQELFGNGQDAAVIRKERPVDKNNVVTIAADQEDLSPKVNGKDVFMFDDMIDTGGTLLQAAKLLKAQGAKSVRIVATHGIFSNDALKKMSDPSIDGVIVTDTFVPSAETVQHPKIEIVPIAPLLVETIRRIESREGMAGIVKSMSAGFEQSYTRLSRINKYRRRQRSTSSSKS